MAGWHGRGRVRVLGDGGAGRWIALDGREGGIDSEGNSKTMLTLYGIKTSVLSE